MAQSRLPMRKIRDVLRLSAAGLSKRQIAASLGIGPTAAGACLRRAREAGINWPLPDDLGDAALECRLYRTPRRLDKALFQQLAACRWIAEHRNLLVTGPCGVGKSWLSCALAQKACRDGYTVHYARVPRLFADLELAHGDGRFARLFRMLTKVDLLILDDWGPDRLNPNQRRDLMEIVEDRYGAGSTLITSQLPVEAWHDVIDEPTFADAILDRLVHNAYRLALDGPSMRDPKTAKSDTTGPVVETADATATKPTKAIKK